MIKKEKKSVCQNQPSTDFLLKIRAVASGVHPWNFILSKKNYEIQTLTQISIKRKINDEEAYISSLTW